MHILTHNSHKCLPRIIEKIMHGSLIGFLKNVQIFFIAK